MADAVYLALGITSEGTREVLGLWIAENEGAKFWLGVMNELRNRGVQDILIAVVDGLKGFPEAITAAFPETTVQTCIVGPLKNADFGRRRGVVRPRMPRLPWTWRAALLAPSKVSGAPPGRGTPISRRARRGQSRAA